MNHIFISTILSNIGFYEVITQWVLRVYSSLIGSCKKVQFNLNNTVNYSWFEKDQFM